MCTEARETLAALHEAGVGETEREWLHLARLICTSYEHNRADGWDAALSHAETVCGADQGPALVARIAVMIRALRAERRGGFGYLSPHCPSCRMNITLDEWQLITLMRAGSRGDRHGTEEAAADLARRMEAPVLADAAVRFGQAAGWGRPAQRTQAGAMLH